ncbi:MAG TPA: tetratricopeptide repeat protein [Caldithrix abyssi]|uniref:Tetratricopeptide repeat protein n=1 Tax=Caldithrix abyssi TaxID=187145 RepID=A0A7V4U0Z8_CALAY|nr:tetratricopeptide repeat protein [Caldithrix abyssi]
MFRKITVLLLITGSLSLAQSNSESSDFSYPLKLYNEKFYDLAASQFIKFYNKYPNSAKAGDARYYAGMAYFNLKKYPQARVEFQSLAIENPGHPKAAEGWFRTGLCYLNMGDKKEAVKAFKTIRLIYPQSPLAAEGIYRAGVIYLELDDTGSAIESFNVILDRYPASPYYVNALIKAARANLLQTDTQKARLLVEKALASNPQGDTAAEGLLVQAQIFTFQGDYNRAKQTYSDLLKTYPQSAYSYEALLALSDMYIRENAFDRARQYLTQHISQVKDSSALNRMHQILADVYFLDGKYALAQAEYEKVLYQPGDSLWLALQLKYALSFKKQNLAQEAVSVLQKALDAYKNNRGPLYSDIHEIYLGWLVENGNYAQAINSLHRQIIHADDPVGRVAPTLRLVKILKKMGQWQDIIRELEDFLLIQNPYPQKDDVYFELANAYEKTNRFEESAAFYRKIITDFAASEYYQTAKERLEYLEAYEVVDKDKAVNRLANMVSQLLISDEKASLQFELGKIYYSDLKDYRRAIEQFSAALQNDPRRPGDIYLYLGRAYLKLAQRRQDVDETTTEFLEQASKYFKEALQNKNTCSEPDGAAWCLVKTGMQPDSLSVDREKKFLTMLLTKYPQSKYREEWYENLAFTLAFDERYQKESRQYFEILVNEYKDSPKYPEYLLNYAKLIKSTDTDKALDIFKKIALEYANAHAAVSALFEVASYYEEQKMYTEAKQLYSRLINRYYYSDVAERTKKSLGRIYVLAGEYEQAIEFLLPRLTSPFLHDYLLTREYMPADLYDEIYFLARAYHGLDRDKQALDMYRLYLNVAVSGQHTEQTKFNMGKIYFDKDQKRVALDFFKTVSGPDSALTTDAGLYIATIYFDLQEYDKAAQAFGKLRKTVKDKDKAQEIFGKQIVALLRVGKLKEASPLIKAYKRMYKEDKKYTAWFVLEYGKYYRSQKEFNKAIKFFNQVKNKYGSSEYADDAEYFLALTYLTLNKNEEAFKILSNFYTNYPKSDRLPEVLNSLGSLYFRSEKFDDAINMFRNALKICKTRELKKNILSNLIKTYTFTGFWDAAQATARQYVEEFPDADDIIVKKIIIGRSYINLNQFQNAVEYLRKIKREADSDTEPEIQFYIGDAYLKAGEYENAIAEFVKIPLLSKKTKLQWEASALYYSGQAYEKLGRIPDAVRMYQEIIKRPGIDLTLKKEAEKRIKQIRG